MIGCKHLSYHPIPEYDISDQTIKVPDILLTSHCVGYTVTTVSHVFEPTIREFFDRGVLWLLESPENFHDFLLLLSDEITAHLDFSSADRINRSFVADDLHKLEADLLYKMPFRDEQRDVFVYLLLEHQSTPDRFIVKRFNSYMNRVWETEQRHWDDHSIPSADRLC